MNNGCTQTLDFEKPIVELEEELNRVRQLVEDGEVSKAPEVEKLKNKLEKLSLDIYGNLSAYQQVRLSRHLDRPFTLDYVQRLVTDFVDCTVIVCMPMIRRSLGESASSMERK